MELTGALAKQTIATAASENNLDAAHSRELHQLRDKMNFKKQQDVRKHRHL
jgi:hypothetical protein